ncbi:MAG TPA: GNAT family protein [Symbiobacteriaceae bacterium]|nr:GNAT family protein [Symbiobacteriaceae bacterium]
MFTRDGVTLRPLEPSDIETMYPWHLDYELDLLSSWGPRRSYAQFEKRWESKMLEPDDDMVYFGVVYEDRLVGRVQLALIDREQRRAAVGIVIGDRSVWSRGVGRTALRILYDYAFSVENLERLYAEVYGFNTRSLRLMTASGMKGEGILLGHELHNGGRQDVHVFGLLRDTFYREYDTMFRIPGR